MIGKIKRVARVSAAISAIVPKQFLAYSIWVWTELFVQIMSLVIFYYFWRAVYAGRPEIGGLTFVQTLNYILLAQILMPVVVSRLILNFGSLVHDGLISIELLRPIDFQWRFYIEELTGLGINLVLKLPLLLIAWFFLGLRVSPDPQVWLAFLLTLILGQAIIFFFDWIFACLAFYTTETWGLSIVREGVALFFSGALVPLALMPAWLRNIASGLPFAQALSVPVSLLSGITPITKIAGMLLVQVVWLVGLGVLSRWVFNLAVRKVTVQGG